MAYVYKHTRVDKNEIFYIGISNDNSYKRAYSKLYRNDYWVNITNTIEYVVEIIEDNLTWEDACEKEKYWIKYYGRKDLNEGTLVNMTNGGEGIVGNIVSIETKNKMSLSHIGKTYSESSKQKMSLSQTGKKLTPETKKKISDYNKANNIKPPNHLGKKRSLETKEKMKLARKPLTEEARQKIIDSNKSRTGRKYKVKV